MTQDEIIIAMARKAGFVFPETQEDSFTCWWEELERFAALVAAHEREKLKNVAIFSKWYEELDKAVLAEREACAKVCDDIQEVWLGEPVDTRPGYYCGAAIRARGVK